MSNVQRLSKQTLVGAGGLIGKQTLDIGRWTLKQQERESAIEQVDNSYCVARSKPTNAPRRFALFD